MSDRRWAAASRWFVRPHWHRSAAMAQWNPPNPVVSFEKQSNGLEIHQKDGVLRLEVDAPDVLHVTYSPLDASQPSAPFRSCGDQEGLAGAQVRRAADDKAITLTTQKLKVVVERESGALHYHGRRRQATDHRQAIASLHPAEVNGETDLPCGSVLSDLRVA